jgi:cob(I)alamin adenosyltransferase
MKVYTKTGDDGTTGLLYGGRVDKHDLRTTAYGTVDETCSALGLARAELDGDLHEQVLEVQRELFVVGAQLATLVEHWDRLVAG